MADQTRPILLLGPTAGGKTDLAIGLAENLGGQIIGADSMQVYRHMDAGTAKPSPTLRRRVTHHLIDCVEPTERFTVADWLSHARVVIAELQERGVRPIIVGGTNLYIKALTAGLFDGPPIDQEFRASLTQTPGHVLHERLRGIDPSAASQIHTNDRKRLIRALEVFHATGTPISALQTQWVEAPDMRHATPSSEPFLTIGLQWPVDAINRRINLRVKGMFYPSMVEDEDGLSIWEPRSLPDEVQELESLGLLGAQARHALGYKQVLAHHSGRCTLEEAFERTKIDSRRFAKQQRTWFRRYRDVCWLEAFDQDTSQLVAKAVQAVCASDNAGHP